MSLLCITTAFRDTSSGLYHILNAITSEWLLAASALSSLARACQSSFVDYVDFVVVLGAGDTVIIRNDDAITGR